MSTTTTTSSIANDVLAPPAALTRASNERERRLADYVRAHTGADVTVRLSREVDTAFVVPTSEEALRDTENASIPKAEATRLVTQIDADYLIVISTQPATLDRLPITDQLTADRAQQFGYALHELGHIRYTAMAKAAALLEKTIDEPYQEFVDRLWNACEDAAIEHQLAVDQSQIAADRLTLTRQSISRHADEVADDAQRQYTFADAVDTALYDQGIYETGTLDVLCDPADSRLTFYSDADRQAYEHVADDLRQLLADILSTPDSLERAERLVECWQTVLQPLIDPSHKPQSADNSPTATGGGNSRTTTDSGEVAQKDTTRSATAPNEDAATADTDASESSGTASAGTGSQPSSDEIRLDRTHDTNHSNALDYPSIDDAEPADALAPADQSSAETAASTQSPHPAENSDTPISSDETRSGDATTDPPAEPTTADTPPQQPATTGEETADDSGADDPTTPAANDDAQTGGAASSADSNQEATEATDAAQPDTSSADASSSQQPWGTGQTTLDQFADATPTAAQQADTETTAFETAPADQSATETANTAEPDATHEADETPTDSAAAGTNSDTTASSDSMDTVDSTVTIDSMDNTDTTDTTVITVGKETMEQSGTDAPTTREEAETANSDDHDSAMASATDSASTQSETPPTPSPAHSADQLDKAESLAVDHDAAQTEAKHATPEQAAIDQELTDVAEALAQREESTGATPASLEELSLMPTSDTVVDPQRWQAATASAAFVGETFRTALRESQRTDHRSGVTSGTFDRQRAGALARGAVNAFQVRQHGDEKAYDLVLILDRSRSMRTSITTAENALVRFALACEEIGINVAIIDFLSTQARLVKPFSVDCAYLQGSLLSGDTAGKTPLADTLGFARELLEQRANHPLILVVTDGKPGKPDAYHDELAACYAPVCGFTLVLDKPTGHVPSRVADNEQFYDRHVYVHEPDQLNERLDQFAVMFDGL
jgi:hypothetical protein